MVLRFSSSLLRQCIGSMNAVCAAFLALPIANEKSSRQTILDFGSL
jgi:hypothetical protein